MKTLLLTSTTALLLGIGGTGTLSASHPQRDDMARVQVIAHELAEAARHVHREAEKRSHHRDRSEAYALERLHELDASARHFHIQVERYRRDPYHTERDFLELRDAYFRAARSLGALHGDGHVRRDFDRVSYRMQELDRYYLRTARYSPHGRYDGRHDRYAVPRPRFELRWRW